MSMIRVKTGCSGCTLVRFLESKAPAAVVAVDILVVTQRQVDFRMPVKFTAITRDLISGTDINYFWRFYHTASMLNKTEL